MSDTINVSREELQAEIDALQRQAQEAQLTIFKIEGALQFAHHLLRQIDAADGKHETIEGAKV